MLTAEQRAALTKLSTVGSWNVKQSKREPCPCGSGKNITDCCMDTPNRRPRRLKLPTPTQGDGGWSTEPLA